METSTFRMRLNVRKMDANKCNHIRNVNEMVSERRKSDIILVWVRTYLIWEKSNVAWQTTLAFENRLNILYCGIARVFLMDVLLLLFVLQHDKVFVLTNDRMCVGNYGQVDFRSAICQRLIKDTTHGSRHFLQPLASTARLITATLFILHSHENATAWNQKEIL